MTRSSVGPAQMHLGLNGLAGQETPGQRILERTATGADGASPGSRRVLADSSMRPRDPGTVGKEQPIPAEHADNSWRAFLPDGGRGAIGWRRSEEVWGHCVSGDYEKVRDMQKLATQGKRRDGKASDGCLRSRPEVAVPAAAWRVPAARAGRAECGGGAA
jgi:hypothetical protein